MNTHFKKNGYEGGTYVGRNKAVLPQHAVLQRSLPVSNNNK